jgi:DNA invertase Pin-like site-specific DNA recombinase
VSPRGGARNFVGGYRIDEARRGLVRQLRAGGLTAVEVAVRAGVGARTVRRLAPGPPPWIGAERRARVRELAGYGVSAGRIARLVGVSERSVRRILKEGIRGD